MASIQHQIDFLVQQVYPDVCEIRRDLHRNPEVSYKEIRTTEVIVKELSTLGFEVLRPLETGCVAVLHGGVSSSRVIALRADIDALPMDETGEHKAAFLSQNPGAAHCCGHDVHTANLLGTARVLAQLKEHIPGTVVLVFQPGEEKLPGGGRLLMETGVLQGLGVQSIYGMHTYPFAKPGEIKVIKGPMMARPDEFTLKVLGKGGHAASPHLAVDPIVISAQIVTLLQSIITRSVNPLEPAVLTVGKIEGGSAHNVIPASVSMLGTIRTFSAELANHISDKIQATASAVAEAAGGSIEYTFSQGYPAVVNTDWAVDAICDVADGLDGVEASFLSEPVMAGEDFSFYQQEIPGSFMYLGSGSPESGSDTYNWHHPLYNADERSLITGMKVMCGLVFAENSTP
ncbi:MAG TPA: amidohydrolase [Bacteroidetes bacterium]|nr:amidohydrolase [Bacteroidota bacterium]